MTTLTDEELRSMSPEDRRDLTRRLAEINSPHLRPHPARRRVVLVICIGATLFLLGWIPLIAISLPRHYVAAHWVAAWVGFDIGELALLAATAYLGLRRRQAVVLTAFTSAALLVCDAWFDLTTAATRGDQITTLVSAFLGELPLAALLFAMSWWLLSQSLRRAYALAGHDDHPVSFLRMPIQLEFEPGPFRRGRRRHRRRIRSDRRHRDR